MKATVDFRAKVIDLAIVSRWASIWRRHLTVLFVTIFPTYVLLLRRSRIMGDKGCAKFQARKPVSL